MSLGDFLLIAGVVFGVQLGSGIISAFFPRKPQPSAHRGTLTYLPDGRLIVGLPFGTTDDVAERVGKQVATYVHSPKPLAVFPWPVDVVDLRTSEPVR